MHTRDKRFLYLIETDGICKIGVTNDVAKRMVAYPGFSRGIYWETPMASSVEHIIINEFANQKTPRGREHFHMTAHPWIARLVSTVLMNAHRPVEPCEIAMPRKRPRGRPRGKKVWPVFQPT